MKNDDQLKITIMKYQDCGCPKEYPCLGGHLELHRCSNCETIIYGIIKGIPLCEKCNLSNSPNHKERDAMSHHETERYNEQIEENKTMDKATPRPWETRKGKADHVCIYLVGTDFNVAVGCKKEDAELIVRAVNAHEDLVKACKAIVEDHESKQSYEIDPSSCCHIPDHTDLCPYALAKQALEKAGVKS